MWCGVYWQATLRWYDRMSKENERKRKDILQKLEKMILVWVLFHIENSLSYFLDQIYWYWCSLHVWDARHKLSWEEVQKYVDERLKVWSVKTGQAVIPTLLPWIESSMDSLTFMRTEQEEGVILWVNLPNAGVVGAMKREYFLQLITGLIASRPNNSVCVILHANRASDGKQKKIRA